MSRFSQLGRFCLAAQTSNVFRFVGGLVVVAILCGIPYGYLRYRDANFRNFRIVKQGVLYRSGQMSLAGLKRVIRDHGIKTVVSLRSSKGPEQRPPDADEEAYCRGQEMDYYRIPPRAWEAADGSAPAAVGVEEFCRIMSDPKHHPVLVHCFAGVHRTGAYVAIYRMEFEGWSNEQALAELRARGYDNLDKEDDVRGFLERYVSAKPQTRGQ